MIRGSEVLTQSQNWRGAALIAGVAATVLAFPAAAQDEEVKEPRRYRVTGGVQFTPRYPGADDPQPSPMVNLDRARGDTPFKFEAPDDGFGIEIVRTGGFAFGPVLNFEDKRSADDVGAAVPEVDFSLEVGAVAKFEFGDNFRLRGELRKGVTGHKAWVGVAGADYIARDGDRWLFSLGPRITWSDNKYQDAWFGVTPATSIISGVPAYNPGGGIQAYGATATFLTRFDEHWGISTYAKYDRLTGDAADSPLVRQFGSRDQLSGGVALTYTFEGDIFD